MTKRVLICDDSLLMRKMIGDALIAAGWEVVAEANDGEEAVREYAQKNPDAVTMDIVMPGVDGFQGLQGILDNDPRAKVVIVSALNNTKSISDAIRKGAHDFIGKPFMPEELQETLDRCCDESTAP